MALVVAKNVSKSFGSNKALQSIDFTLAKGKIIGLVGPDGAGKTTLIRLLGALLTPDNETDTTLEVLGFSMPKESQDAQNLIGYMPQKFGLYEELSVEENLKLYASLQSIPKKNLSKRVEELLRFTSLYDFKSFLASQLSGGMKQKLGLACALVKKPKLLLLDEPGVGVDPISRRELFKMVRALLEEDIGVVWSSAYLDEASYFDEVILLNEGKVLFHGEPEKLTQRVDGKAFEIVGELLDKRATLKLALSYESVKDATILGDKIKLVCDSKQELPPLEAIGAPSARYERALATFEDAFINILGANFSGVSALAEQTKMKPRGDEVVIEAKNLTKKFGSFIATDNVSFKVKSGEIFGFLGPNGAGESTTFKMLCALLTPTSGETRVLGESLARTSYKARAKIGYMSQKFSLYGDISVRENLLFFAGIYGLKGKEREEKVQSMLSVFELEKYALVASKELPLGFKQRLSLACAVMHDPVVLFLDEPTSGVDPITRREFWNHIYALAQKGMSVMVTTHFMDEAEYCDKIALIYKGRAIALDSPHNLIREVGEDATMEDAFVELIKRSENA
jgi:ABC-2 type transport system ATP-binding protein